MRRTTLVLVVATAVLTAAVSYRLTNTQHVLSWRFVSQQMMQDYVVAVLACKEDVRRGADALAQLDRFYGSWRRDLLPDGLYRWITRCQELGAFPEFGPDLEQWLQ